jgi:hypothetical protein
MACVLISGNTIDCADSVGGVKTIYMTELGNKSSITTTSGVITAFTLTSGKKFWTFDLEKENAEVTETTQRSVENGTLFYEQSVTFTIKKLKSSSRNDIRLIAQNRLMIIALDKNGVYWLLGELNGVDMGGDNTAKTGKAFGDLSGYTLSFTGKEELPMKEVTASLITALTVPA